MNVGKTKIIVFKKGGFPKKADEVVLQGAEVEIVNQFNYLGMVLSSGESFMKATNTLSSKVVKAMITLFVNVKHTDAHVKITFNLFDTLVTPILSYACETGDLQELKILSGSTEILPLDIKS